MFTGLEGTTVVVVGASSGLGLATAVAAREAGAEVVIVARDRDRLDAARESIGGSTRAYALDAADSDAVAGMFAELGSVDHVASFTGEQPSGSVADTTHEQYQRALDARVWAARNLCAAAAPRMPASGSFTFCSGLSAWRPRPLRATGAGRDRGARVVCTGHGGRTRPDPRQHGVPGFVRHAGARPCLRRAQGRGDEALPVDAAVAPLGPPGELAHAVLFLMTNGYTTGTVLHVDGGSLLI